MELFGESMEKLKTRVSENREKVQELIKSIGKSNFNKKNFMKRVASVLVASASPFLITGCTSNIEKENSLGDVTTTVTTSYIEPTTSEQTTATSTSAVNVYTPEKYTESKIIAAKAYAEPSQSSEEVYTFENTVYKYENGKTRESSKNTCNIVDKPFTDENGDEWYQVEMNDESGNKISGYVLAQYVVVSNSNYFSCYLGGTLKDGESAQVKVITSEGESVENLPKGYRLGPIHRGGLTYDLDRNHIIIPISDKSDSTMKLYTINIDQLDPVITDEYAYIINDIEHSDMAYVANTDYNHMSESYTQIEERDLSYTLSYNGDPGYELVCGYGNEMDYNCYVMTDRDGKQYIVNDESIEYDDIKSLANATHLTLPEGVKKQADYKEYTILADRNLRSTPGIGIRDEDKDKNLDIAMVDANGNTITTNIVIPQGAKVMLNNSESYCSDGYKWMECTYSYNGSTVHGYIAAEKLSNINYAEDTYRSYVQANEIERPDNGEDR